MPSSLVYVMIGIPGSGKSTFADSLHLPRLSADDIRAELCGDVTDQSRNGEVWDIFYARLSEMVQNDLVIDVTNAQGKQRRKLLSEIRKHNDEASIRGIWFDLPLDLCKMRNANRARVVPEFVLDRMYQQLQSDPPLPGEGYNYFKRVTQ